MNHDQQQFAAPHNYHYGDATTTAAATSPTTAAAVATAALATAASYMAPPPSATAQPAPPPPTTTTYVTIGMLPPHAGHSLNVATTITQPATTMTNTSSFKTTTLLPMPTLEDIECGSGGGGGGVGEVREVAGVVDNSYSYANVMLGSNMLPPPPPPGILKYSNGPPATATSSSPPPPPPMAAITTYETGDSNKYFGALSGTESFQQQQQMPPLEQQQQQQPTLLLLQQQQHYTLQQQQHQHSLQQPPPHHPSVGTTTNSATTTAISAPAGILSNSTSSTILASNIAASSSNNFHSSSSALNNAGGAATGRKNAAGGKSGAKRKCCACFGGSRTATEGETLSTKYSSTTTTTTKKKKPTKTQTLWAGLLTNLGICALLLAYTLLGSFIFLTIENEDASLLHHQRTLASTKRVASLERSLDRSRIIYHTQPQYLDNGTMVGISASSSSSSASSSSSSSSSSSADDTSTMHDNHEFGISDSQLALSADTYDVRQRTIENIWDITVSLNILYKENWTKLAALEIAKFQDQLVKRLNEDALLQLSQDIDANNNNANGMSPATEAVLLLSPQHGGIGHHHNHHHHGGADHVEWNFAKAFLYSLTVLTTIGYGNIAPKTTLGRLVTLAYAILGIPLTLVYLSSTGGLLAKVAREVFSKALCCCLCSNCGYCCYDEKRMAEKERRTKRKRQQEELRKQQAAMQEPYYVRSGSLHSSFHSPEKQPSSTPMMSGGGPQPPSLPLDMDSLSASESRGSMHGLSILAPILLCLSMMIIYILFGAVVLYRLENWPLLDGVYFCFMSLSTIGFGDLIPGLHQESSATTWFCSIYIMSGMALTAMCFNVIHEEIVHRIKIVVEFKKGSTLDSMNDEQGYYMAAPPP